MWKAICNLIFLNTVSAHNPDTSLQTGMVEVPNSQQKRSDQIETMLTFSPTAPGFPIPPGGPWGPSAPGGPEGPLGPGGPGGPFWEKKRQFDKYIIILLIAYNVIHYCFISSYHLTNISSFTFFARWSRQALKNLTGVKSYCLFVSQWEHLTAVTDSILIVVHTCSPTGPGGPGNPRDPSSPFWPKRPCWPLGPGSPSAPCTTTSEKAITTSGTFGLTDRWIMCVE